MARLTSREICIRKDLKTGEETFHSNELGKTGYTLRAINEKLYRQYEGLAEVTENVYSHNDEFFRWSYKTVRYNLASFKNN